MQVLSLCLQVVMKTKCYHLKGIKGDGGMSLYVVDLGKMSQWRATKKLLAFRITLVQLKSNLPLCLTWGKPEFGRDQIPIHRYKLNK